MTNLIQEIQDKKTRDFAEACYDMNTLDELETATLPDETDLKTWGINKYQWLLAIGAASVEKKRDQE